MKFPYHILALLTLFSASIITAARGQTTSQSALIEGAKKEGKLVWYTSMAIDTSKPLLDAFLQEYPFIKPDLVRAGEEQRVERERRRADQGGVCGEPAVSARAGSRRDCYDTLMV